jgi:hypothetical protein
MADEWSPRWFGAYSVRLAFPCGLRSPFLEIDSHSEIVTIDIERDVHVLPVHERTGGDRESASLYRLPGSGLGHVSGRRRGSKIIFSSAAAELRFAFFAASPDGCGWQVGGKCRNLERRRPARCG